MNSRTAVGAVCVALSAGSAGAQTRLFGFRANGDAILVDRATGVGTLVARNAIECDAAASFHYPYGRSGEVHGLLIAGGTGATADQVTGLEGWTASGPSPIPTAGRPAGYSVRGLAVLDQTGSSLAVLLASDDPSAPELLADITAGNYSVVAPLARRDLWSLATSAPNGAAYTLAAGGDGTLYTIDLSTGALTMIGGGGYGGDDHALAFVGPQLFACGDNLRSVNAATGVATLIGPTGFTDIRGLALTSGCYANCDSGGNLALNVNDFICFQSTFAGGEAYANCDLSTTPPVLNVNDFICFQQRFASFCSAP